MYLVNYFIEAIFNGALIIAILLLLVMLFKWPVAFIDKQMFIQAINITLLFGAIIYILLFITQLFVACYSQADYEQFAVVNRIFGPYWYTWALLFLGAFILPQLIWIKRCRQSIIITIVILFFYKLVAVIEFISVHFFNNSNWAVRVEWPYREIPIQLVIYMPILWITYFIMIRKYKMLNINE